MATNYFDFRAFVEKVIDGTGWVVNEEKSRPASHEKRSRVITVDLPNGFGAGEKNVRLIFVQQPKFRLRIEGYIPRPYSCPSILVNYRFGAAHVREEILRRLIPKYALCYQAVLMKIRIVKRNKGSHVSRAGKAS